MVESSRLQKSSAEILRFSVLKREPSIRAQRGPNKLVFNWREITNELKLNRRLKFTQLTNCRPTAEKATPPPHLLMLATSCSWSQRTSTAQAQASFICLIATVIVYMPIVK